MRNAIFLAILALPLIEIALLIKAGGVLGFWPVFGLVIASGVLGSMVLRRYSLSVAMKAARAIEQGEPTAAPLVESALVAASGFLLIAPGLVTDVLGLLLLIPPLRRLLADRLAGYLEPTVVWRTDQFDTEANRDAAAARGPGRTHSGGFVIEGEFERIDERDSRPQAGGPLSRRP